MKLSTRSLLPATAMLVAVVGLAACGSSSSNSSPATTTNKPAAQPTVAAVIKSANNPNLGKILVDASGKTVYTLTNNGAAVACTGGCLAAWPPVVLAAGASTATGGSGVSGLTVVTMPMGKQVAEKGLPLYTFANDTAAGDAKGDGLSSFGGTWHVVKLSGGAAPAASSSTTTTAPYSSNY
jgi:predicted lipoprotein with Yx(FWY)xxD motif